MKKLIPLIYLIAVLLCFLTGCTRKPPKDASQAMRLTQRPPPLRDDLPLSELMDAIGAEITQLARAPESTVLRFGPAVYTRAEYLKGLQRLVELGKSARSPGEFTEKVGREFDFYEVYGQQSWGDVFMTSYYEPVLQGSLKPEGSFTQPLYSTPEDLLSLNLAAFDPKFADERKLRGRLVNRAVVPYYTREEIDARGALRNRRLELCFVDPIDAFNLQIQGSGTVKLADGRELRLNYAEKNGQPYQSIGNFLRKVIPAGQMNMPSIEAYLRRLDAANLQRTLIQNPSYVFFKLANQNALTAFGVPATAGRTIATDPRYFPKGALAFLVSPRPKDGAGEEISRFVLDQDVGGAIKGAGRLDLFWGRGGDAGAHAGQVQQRGTLYYLAPKR